MKTSFKNSCMAVLLILIMLAVNFTDVFVASVHASGERNATKNTEEFDSAKVYGDEISFKDETLRNAVAKALNTSGDDNFKITQNNIKDLTRLEYPPYGTGYDPDNSEQQGKKIKKLDGLEHATSLESLSLVNTQITDISPIKNLTSLNSLYLNGNKINNIQPIENLTNLESIELINNQITDISPIKNLTSLKKLDLSKNGIGDLKSIEALKNSTSLETLYLSDNNISNIDPIKELKDLTIYELNLSNNQITDISSVASLKNLYDLDLSNNQIKTLKPIEQLENLGLLYVKNNQITDLSPITNNTRLFTLDASGNKITDIKPLSKLANLSGLYLKNNQIVDISSIKSLTKLEDLNLENNQIKDIPENLSLESLKIFDLSDNNISDVKSLGELKELKIFDLSKNHISNLKPIENIIENLKSFNASGQKIIIDLKNFNPQTIEHPIKVEGTEYEKGEPKDKYEVKNGEINIKEKIDKDEIVIKFDTKKYGLKTVIEGSFEYDSKTVEDPDGNLKGEIILRSNTTNINVGATWLDEKGNTTTAPVETITATLYRDGKATNKTITLSKSNNWTAKFDNLPISEAAGTAVSRSVTDKTVSLFSTFNLMAMADSLPVTERAAAKVYKYSVKEVGEENGGVQHGGKWYSVTYTGDMKNGFTITHKLKPKKISFTATKEWIGDIKATRPTVVFELWRKVETTDEKVSGVEKKEINGTTTTATWKELDEKNSEGKKYTYYVKEKFKDNDITNQNWSLGKFDEKENKIKNTVITEKVAKLTIKKVLENEPVEARMMKSVAEPIKFEFKVTGPYGYEKTFSLAAGEEKVLDKLYYGEYKVEETNAQGYTPNYSETDGKVTLTNTDTTKTITVTNKNIIGPKNPNVLTKTVEKVWKNGPKPDTVIELWRKNNVAGDKKVDEKVGEFTANSTTTSHEFKNLAKHDKNGYEFEYYAKEPNVPANYTSTINGLTVTNTFILPKSNHIIAKKVWIDADLAEFDIPEIKFELWRKTSFSDPELVVPKTFVPHDDYSDVDTIDFGVQDELNPSGERYEYFVREVFADAHDEYDWEKREDGLVVENRYVGPLPEGELEKKVKIDDRKTDIHKAYLKGYPDNSLRPDGEITRAEAAAIISRLEGYDLTNFSTPDFPDTNVNWYKPFINAVVSHKVMRGYPDGTFKPNESITRAEFAMMLMPIDKMNNAVSRFNDVRGHWAEKAINQAFGNKRIDGYPDGKFRPNAFITRAEAASMINRKYNRVVDKKGLMDRYYKYIAHFTDLKVNEWYYYDMIEATNTHEFKRRGTKDKYFREHEDWIKVLKSNIN